MHDLRVLEARRAAFQERRILVYPAASLDFEWEGVDTAHPLWALDHRSE
jgi:hypothetical protein